MGDSNSRPDGPKPPALPTALIPDMKFSTVVKYVVKAVFQPTVFLESIPLPIVSQRVARLRFVPHGWEPYAPKLSGNIFSWHLWLVLSILTRFSSLFDVFEPVFHRHFESICGQNASRSGPVIITSPEREAFCGLALLNCNSGGGVCKGFLPRTQHKICGAIDKEIGLR